ncbi:hypothetical protein K2X85_17470 [bacterium]|nr:hypothetical protein [bacterium]
MLRWFVVVLMVAHSVTADACPNCAKGLAAGDRDRGTRTQLAYNTSVVFMAGMPFLLTGFFGVTFWRLSRQPRPSGQPVRREEPNPPCR